jgi:hypothetical protein
MKPRSVIHKADDDVHAFERLLTGGVGASILR